MTIQDHLLKKARPIFIITIAGWLITAVSMFVNMLALTSIGFFMFICGILATIYTIKCPRCDIKLGHLIMQNVFKSKKNYAIKFCPSCGVSFDDEI